MGATAGLAKKGSDPFSKKGSDQFSAAEKGSDPFSTPIFIPAALGEWADAQLAGLPLGDLRVAHLLTERAAISGYVSQGSISPGGSCRLLEAADGWLALNLARDEDWDLLPAWLEGGVAPSWDAVARAVRGGSARALVARGRDMGLAVAVDEIPEAKGIVGAGHGSDPIAPMGRCHKQPSPTSCHKQPSPRSSHKQPSPTSCHKQPSPRSSYKQLSPRGSHKQLSPRGSQRFSPRVIDLSALWAGPLCGHLLHRLGADVVKVESLHRPDGARRGPALFFDLLNAGKASVALDFTTAGGRAQLRALIDSADIVIEASRPRALRQLGLDASVLCAQRPGLIWLSITAYGRAPATENWIGYGDDVAVAAGLTAVVHAVTGVRGIVGDAIADPLTGIRAARLVWDAWQSGAGGLLDVSLHDTIRHALANWGQTEFSKPLVSPGPRRIRTPAGSARELGADTVVQLREAAGVGSGETGMEPGGLA